MPSYPSRIIPSTFASLLIIALIHIGHAQEGKTNLEDAIQKLNERLERLEKDIMPRLVKVEKQLEAVFAEKKLEIDAKNAYNEINTLVSQAKFDEAKGKIAEFMKHFGTTRYARSIASFQQELAVIGKESPKEWGIEKWFQGQEEIDLDKSSTTVLVFWEMWCPHCVREVPKLQKLYNKHKDSGLQLVGLTKLSKSATEEKLTEFISDNNVEYPIAKEDGAISQYFNVSGIPAAAVVREGRVVWRGHPSRLTEDLLQSWL